MRPATLGPMAWGSRKLFGSASCPSLCDIRAAMGTADTPADPMSGLINLANKIPPIVPNENATIPKAKMAKVPRSNTRSADH